MRLAPALLVLTAAACAEGEDRTKTVRDRNEAIVSTATPAGKPSASAVPAKKAPRTLCSRKPAGRTPDAKSESRIRTASALGAAEPPTPVPFGAGKWIWVNLWAAWCGPCKEEMPRLLRWQSELRRAGVSLDLAFVSMDDDERQLERFLASQPSSGVRSTYWLKEGDREKWLSSFGISAEATLPVHALVSPAGTLECIIEGAVDDEDFPSIASLVKGR